MTRPIVHPFDSLRSLRASSAVERLHIHLAVCRARRTSLACGTCSDLAERAERHTVVLAEVA